MRLTFYRSRPPWPRVERRAAGHGPGAVAWRTRVKVSFVIPTRNQARFIGRCLDSCLAQRIGDAEILVQDGLSDDGTTGILAG